MPTQSNKASGNRPPSAFLDRMRDHAGRTGLVFVVSSILLIVAVVFTIFACQSWR